MELGNRRAVVERIRDGESLIAVESLIRDIGLGFRNIRRNPFFFITAVLTLALGIGVNCVIFSFLYGLVLRGLSTASPSELSKLGMASHADESGYQLTFMTYPMLKSLRTQLTSFTGISGWDGTQTALDDGKGALRFYSTGLVTGNAFDVIPIRPYLGRMIREYDDVPNGPSSGWPVVLGYGFWTDHFGGYPKIVGTHIRISGAMATVVGVAPPDFTGVWPGVEIQLYLPLQFINVMLKDDVLNAPTSLFGIDAIGRLRTGVSLVTAQAELSS